MKNNSNLKFGLMGATLDTGNMGVSALAASTIALILKTVPNSEIIFFIGNRSCQPQVVEINGERMAIPVMNYRNAIKSPINKQLMFILILAIAYRTIPLNFIRLKILEKNDWLRELIGMDVIGEIRGGDSFSDIYGLFRFLLGCIPVIVSVLVGKNVVLLPMTYGPFKSKVTRIIAKFIITKSKIVLSRDKESIRTINKLFDKDERTLNIMFCPDVAFTLKPKIIKNILIDPPLKEKRYKLIGLNINGLMYRGGYTASNMFGLKMDYKEFCNTLIKSLLNENKYSVLIIPHTFGTPGNINSDTDASIDVINNIQKYNKNKMLHMIKEPYDQSELKAIIGKCDFFIGSRMHSCIAALSQGIYTTGVAYSKKFGGVFESVGMGENVIDGRKVCEHDAVDMILEKLKKLDHDDKKLKNDISIVQQQIYNVFDSFLKKYLYE